MHGHLNRHFAFYTTQQYSEAVAAMSSRHRSLIALITIMAVALPCAAAQPADTPQQPLASIDELKQNFLVEHEIGRRFHVDRRFSAGFWKGAGEPALPSEPPAY